MTDEKIKALRARCQEWESYIGKFGVVAEIQADRISGDAIMSVSRLVLALLDEVERLRNDLEQRRVGHDNLCDEIANDLREAIDRMRPVYEAAKEWRKRIRSRDASFHQGVVVGLADDLVSAIDTAVAAEVP